MSAASTVVILGLAGVGGYAIYRYFKREGVLPHPKAHVGWDYAGWGRHGGGHHGFGHHHHDRHDFDRGGDEGGDEDHDRHHDWHQFGRRR